jgi:ketosteroid isomerase-like protein
MRLPVLIGLVIAGLLTVVALVWMGQLVGATHSACELENDTQVAVERFHEALNRHDLADLAQVIGDGCVFEDTGPPDGTRHVGRDAVLDACRRLFADTPAAHFEMEEVVIAGDRAVVRWLYTWADGHVRGVDLMRVRDGKVAESLAYVKG